ncbi:MAG TPA: hypothetical protein VL128_09520 [Candidatus Eisenbacteria bacterium]|nr:hypothetical protein [Candidatus Eisenbacteria bacterium]
MKYRLVFPYFLTILAELTLPNIASPVSPQDVSLPSFAFLLVR